MPLAFYQWKPAVAVKPASVGMARSKVSVCRSSYEHGWLYVMSSRLRACTQFELMLFPGGIFHEKHSQLLFYFFG